MKTYQQIRGSYYDDLRTSGHKSQSWFYESREAYLLAFAALRKGERVLDVGCGSGAVSRAMAAQGAEVVGADISEDCVRHAALEAKGLPTRFALGAIEALPFLPGSFDVVVASHIIEHVREPARILGDLLACLRPGGRLLLTTPNYRSLWPLAEMVFDHALAEEAYSLHEQHVTKFFPGLLRRLLKDAGFTGIRMESHYILTLPLSLVSRRGADTLLALEKRLASLPFGTILYAQAVRPA